MTTSEAGRKGALSLNKTMTKEQKIDRAKKGAEARWKGHKRKSVPKSLRDRVFLEKGMKCHYCKKNLIKIQKKDRTLDHVKLVCHGGKNTFRNLVPCCRKCNNTRHTMIFDEFIEYLELKKKKLSRMEFWRARQEIIRKYYGK